jgi:hypothetical protein
MCWLAVIVPWTEEHCVRYRIPCLSEFTTCHCCCTAGDQAALLSCSGLLLGSLITTVVEIPVAVHAFDLRREAIQWYHETHSLFITGLL